VEISVQPATRFGVEQVEAVSLETNAKLFIHADAFLWR